MTNTTVTMTTRAETCAIRRGDTLMLDACTYSTDGIRITPHGAMVGAFLPVHLLPYPVAREFGTWLIAMCDKREGR